MKPNNDRPSMIIQELLINMIAGVIGNNLS